MNREYFTTSTDGDISWNEVAAYVHSVNVSKGFWPEDVRTRNVGEALALIHSEITEAVEAASDFSFDDKLPQYIGAAVETADAIIRTLDLGAAFGADFSVDNDDSTETLSPFTSFESDMLAAHSIVSLALETHRKATKDFAAILDVLLKYLLTVMYKYDYSLDIIFDKIAYNTGRPFKHGKSY